MEVEIHGMPQSIKAQFVTRARNAKNDLQRLKSQSRELASAAARDALLGGRTGPAGDDPYGMFLLWSTTPYRSLVSSLVSSRSQGLPTLEPASFRAMQL